MILRESSHAVAGSRGFAVSRCLVAELLGYKVAGLPVPGSWLSWLACGRMIPRIRGQPGNSATWQPSNLATNTARPRNRATQQPHCA